MKSSGIGRRERVLGRRRGRHVAALLALAAALGSLAVLPAGAGAEVIYPPVAGQAVKTAEGFELNGTVYDYFGTTTYHFEYGTTTSYGTSMPSPDATASGTYMSVSQKITGLAPDTTYHWRLVSTNSMEGTAMTADQTFSTATTTAPPTGTSPGEAGNPYPGGAGGGGSTVGGNGPKQVAKALHVKGRTLLTTMKGRTLYSLSAEKHGKFICTAMSGCTNLWHPLTVAAGVVPKGPVKLGTIKRPEGMVQVTYRGLPLYAFGGDKRSGQTNGEGLKDVGTWHAARVPTKSSGLY
jgi:predicted lipoprotein with Yx(FWY)xxD motif